MSSAAALVACLCFAAAVVSAGASGTSFVRATDGRSCAGVCSQQGLTSAFLVGMNNQMQTSVCEANVTGSGRLSGYQLGGDSSCIIAINGSAQSFEEYSCLCLDSQAQGGLVASQSTACDSACNQGFDGLTGSAVSTDSSQSSYACLPSSEIGGSNRFGYTTQLDSEAVICTAAVNGSAVATPVFSCYCSFSTSDVESSSSPSPIPSPPPSPLPSASLAAAVSTQSLSQSAEPVAAGGRRLLSH